MFGSHREYLYHFLNIETTKVNKTTLVHYMNGAGHRGPETLGVATLDRRRMLRQWQPSV
jgi:hypothetical protein